MFFSRERLFFQNQRINKTAKYFVCHDIKYTFEKRIKKKVESCPSNSFLCKKSGYCINLIDVCNGKKDCPLNEDEENCTEWKSLDYFHCESKQQKILFSKVCDYQIDCQDKSDEKYCGTYNIFCGIYL